ncbi:MAG: lipocalin family protein [bacterium]|nr:lipocalin family protein [bacterium]
MTPLQPVPKVDLERFMGDWYVIANIPTFLEKGAVNGIERYRLRSDGDIEISYTFFQDSVRGKRKQFKARGFVVNRQTNSEWRVQFIWPIKLPYYVIELDTAYTFTVIGVPNRKYVWLMSRTPNPEDSVVTNAIEGLRKHGYDPKRVLPVPQIWNGAKPSE